MIDKTQIRALIPHSGQMCLLDAVEAWDEHEIRCCTRTHREFDHPLRRHGRLAAIHLAEYGAQAMAVHGGLLAQKAGARASPGMLTSLHDLKLYRGRVDDLDATLTVIARQRVSGPHGWLYEFEVNSVDGILACGRASVMSM